MAGKPGVQDDILEFTEEQGGHWCLTTSELADELGRETSEVSRALSILLSQRRVRRASETGNKYEPAPHIRAKHTS